MHYDNSPLNRSTGVTPPGQDWAAHPTAIAYKTNSAAVQHWRVNSDGSFSSFSFEANTLYVNENADEDGHITRTYTDKLGQVVLKEAVDENGVAHKTSYIYDDFGLLRCVVPPKNHQSGPTAELSYYYNYDSRKRMIEKRLPGTEWTYYVYDKRDRLAMWQDGVNRAEGKWHYHLYDALNRPVVSGLMSCSITAATLRTDFAAFNGTLYESFAVGNLLFGYTNTSFPVGCRPTSGSVHATTYYDNYNFKQVFTGNYDFPSVPAGGNISNQYLTSGKGMVTGALEMSDLFTNMLTVNYYDNRWQLICSVSDNHLGGRNNHFFRYHFDGQVAERIETHSSSYQPLTTLRYNYTCDHAGRVLVEHLSVDNQPAITLQAHEYNEPGELTGTYLHNSKPAIQGSPFNQKIRKEYNTRGWLTRINNPEHPAYNLFSLSLQYQNPIATGNMGTPSCFNGNIAQTLWHDPIAGNQGYAYRYDGLNRLKGATYGAGSQYEGNTGQYDTHYSYDHNGNMSQLKRKRAGVQIDDLLYSYMNNGNRLESVADGATTDGYVPNTGTYTYDQNGNTTYDPSRGINIQYNHLNLPTRVEFGPDDMVFYYYSTTGTKQGKQVRTWHTAASYTTQYSGSFTYTNNTLSSIATPAGRLVPVLHNGQVHWKTEYNLTDHLGNVRVVFAAHANGQPEVMQQTSYYPFGYTLQQNDFFAGVTSENKNLYNGKELQDDVLAGSKLDWYDYGARFYDPVVGRWHTKDPLSEWHVKYNPYHYCFNNPTNYVDPHGLDTIPAQEVVWENFSSEKDVIDLPGVSVSSTRYSWFRRMLNKVTRAIGNIKFATSSGGTISGGLHLVTNGNAVDPTTTRSSNPDDVETINIDNLLMVIGNAGAGHLESQHLTVANGLNAVNDLVNMISENNKVSDKDILENHTGSSQRTNGNGYPINIEGQVKTEFWVNTTGDTISIASGDGRYNGDVYYPGDTVESTTIESSQNKTKIIKEKKYPSRK